MDDRARHPDCASLAAGILMFGNLPEPKVDALIAVSGALKADSRPFKIDLGVGVYRDELGNTPVLHAVKKAEFRLWQNQATKAYLGPGGDVEFISLMRTHVAGAFGSSDRLVGVQTPGGTGALALAANLIAMSRPATRVWVSLPTWPNHIPLLKSAGLTVATYRHMDDTQQEIDFDHLSAVLESADSGDVVLLHGCCHNSTGADFDGNQWHSLTELMVRRGLVPLVDFAYQGLGDDTDKDALGVRLLLERVPEALVAVSCSKSFGLYRERTGLLLALSMSTATSNRVDQTLQALARLTYSNPPDHGAAVVRTILSDPDLKSDWLDELGSMRQRIRDIRRELATAGTEVGIPLAGIVSGRGLFTMLPLSPQVILNLRPQYGIYMPETGRINVAGLNSASVKRLIQAVSENSISKSGE